MPGTVNGIGTRYAGRQDESAVQANCPFCGRLTRLSSYSTREFFCFVYIPLIPLGRYRIVNQCAVCRRHYRLPWSEFQRRLGADIEPLREAVRRAPNDPEPRVALVEGLMGFQMFGEADAAAREGVAAAPRHARLNRLAAQVLTLRGDLAGATPFYRQAASSAPSDPEIRLACGRHLLARGEHAEAARELGEARRLDPDSVTVLSLLGDAHTAGQRWAEALDAYQQILSRHPELAADRDLLRRMKKCKEALGYPVTAAERKAGRKWWPFGGGRKVQTRPTSGVDGGRIAALLALAVGAIVVIAGGMAVWKQRYADVWLDNGLEKPVRITLDRESFEIPPGPPVSKTVRPGRHIIVVADLQGKEIERTTADIPKLDLFDALGSDRLFVYNVAAAHLYQREEIGYASSEANRTYKQSFVGLERFFQQEGVDYVFQAAPETLSVDSSSSVTRKVAFNVAPHLTFNRAGVIWFEEGRKEDAERAFRRAIEREPCSPMARGNLLHVLEAEEGQPRVIQESRAWLQACPTAVEAHRAYQDAQSSLGHGGDVLEEYRARLAEHPDLGLNHYLYARLLHDPDLAMPLYREAIRRDPALWWAKAALASSLMALERDAESRELLEQVLQAPDHDPAFARVYAMAAIAAGTTEHAGQTLEAAEKQQQEEDDELWQARWLLSLAGGQYDAAAIRLRDRTQRAGEESADDWVRRVQLLRLREDPELAKVLLEGRLRPDVAGIAGTLRMEEALSRGEWKEAAAAIDTLKPEDTSFLDQLYVASALLLGGDRQAAEKRLGALDSQLSAESDASSAALLAMARHLEGRLPAAAVLASARRAGFNMLPHAYFVLAAARSAAGDTAGARELFEKSRRRALTFDLPYFAAAARAKG
jgi:tetratricopeptide (TPR) repeat protein